MSALVRVQSARGLLTLALTKPLIKFKNNLSINSSALSNPSVNNNEIINLNINGKKYKFPSIWLRDNCQCEKCFHASAQSRIINWSKFDIDISPSEIVEKPTSVTVKWSDGHKSEFNHDWLQTRSFAPKDQIKHTTEFYKPSKQTWKGEHFLDILKKFDYATLLQSDQVFHDWLQDLSVFGVTLIQKTPSNENAVDKIIERIAFIKKTHYGEKFIVENRPNTSNVAYLSSNLQVHTDLPYYEYVPGVNLLHCITQTTSEGGNNLLSDSHYVANYMKIHHPKEYQILIDTEVEWSDIGVEFGKEFHKLYRSPVICEDKHQEISRINFSVPQRGTYFPTNIQNVKPWYAAHHLFLQMSHKFVASFKTNAGEILAFDNMRLLHGRAEYMDTGDNVRKLVGAYMDWDEIYSKLRCLKIKLKIV